MVVSKKIKKLIYDVFHSNTDNWEIIGIKKSLTLVHFIAKDYSNNYYRIGVRTNYKNSIISIHNFNFVDSNEVEAILTIENFNNLSTVFVKGIIFDKTCYTIKKYTPDGYLYNQENKNFEIFSDDLEFDEKEIIAYKLAGETNFLDTKDLKIRKN